MHSRFRTLPLLLVSLAACRVEQMPAGPQPDVVIVLVDTLRADFLEPHGFDLATTPNLTALAEESVVFEQAHAPAPWTLPSVVSILSGRHLAEHNVATEQTKLSPRLPILSELLREEGYYTASFHKNAFAGRKSGLDRGFDVCELLRRDVDGKFLEPFYDQLAAGKPYFLYVHNAEPHDPHMSRKRFLRSFEEFSPEFLDEFGRLVAQYRSLTRVDYVKKRALGTTDNTEQQSQRMAALSERVEKIRTLYASSVRDADDRIGSIIDQIRSRGRWDRTLLIVLSDHGEEMDDHGGWQHDQSLYQELLHVPLLVKLPDGAHAGARVSTPISLVDVLPTVLEAAGAKPPSGLSGTSLLPLIESEPEPQPRLVAIRNNARKYYRPYKEERGDLNIAVRWGDWKGILNVETATFELYDLSLDPGEQHDLSQERPEVTERLRTFAAESYASLLRNSVSAQEDGGLDEADVDVLENMRALGYIGGEDE